jgi:hypothetical protein
MENILEIIGLEEMGALLGMGMAFFILSIALYIYISLAFMAIGKKAKYSTPGIAWIPGIGPLIITAKTAKMHWWPILLILIAWVPVLGQLAYLTLLVFSIIWLWKTFEVINVEAWWAILYLLPIVNLVIIGIAAWGKK